MILAQLFPDYSRARLQAWIKNGRARVDGRQVKPNARLVGGENIALTPEPEDQGEWTAQALPVDCVYQDEALLVLNKPAGLVVHPAAGNADGTLLNGLLHHWPELRQVPRAGIVHRLDKDTTGLMVVAKTLSAHSHLVEQLQARTVARQYLAVVHGLCPAEGRIDAPIGRDPNHRKKMAVTTNNAKEAVTHFQVVRRLGFMSMVKLKLETGRTHQIRVHMAHLGYPLVGDPFYGPRLRKNRDWPPEVWTALQTFPRQALHAQQLGLQHPVTGAPMVWQVPLPEDLAGLIQILNGGVALDVPG